MLPTQIVFIFEEKTFRPNENSFAFERGVLKNEWKPSDEI